MIVNLSVGYVRINSSGLLVLLESARFRSIDTLPLTVGHNKPAGGSSAPTLRRRAPDPGVLLIPGHFIAHVLGIADAHVHI